EEALLFWHRVRQPGSWFRGVEDLSRNMDDPRQRMLAHILFAILSPGSRLGSQSKRAVEIDCRLREAGPKALPLQHRLAVLIDERTAIKNQTIVGAEEIDVRHRTLAVGGPGGNQFAAGLDDSDPKRRCGDVCDDL